MSRWKLIHALPELGGDELANRPKVVAGAGDGGDDRARVVDVAHEELADRHRVASVPEIVEVVDEAQDREHVGPRPGRFGGGSLEQAVVRDVEDAGGVLGAFDVAASPEEVLGVTGEHQPTTVPPGSGASTHVSFEPPP
jgi:hypothetical protein